MKNHVLLISLFFSFAALAQEDVVQLELDTGSIENQFDYIITKSSSYKEFQLIRRSSILKVKKHAIDSLNIVRKEWSTTKEALSKMGTTIQQLEADAVRLKNEKAKVVHVKDKITFLGGDCSKSTYNSMMWSIIGVLIIALLFFVLQFKNNYIVSKHNKEEIKKLGEELDLVKKKALKKEQELMRKLQDELNKNNHR